MYESGHSSSREELRLALLQLEEALARHEPQVQVADRGEDTRDPALQVLRRSIRLMRQEADRLRGLLASS